MEYKKYIELGFKRTDCNDGIEFDQTGYYGFALEKHITDNIMIAVSSGDLDKPKLYIKKKGLDQYHIMLINDDIVIDMVSPLLSEDYKKGYKGGIYNHFL